MRTVSLEHTVPPGTNTVFRELDGDTLERDLIELVGRLAESRLIDTPLPE